MAADAQVCNRLACALASTDDRVLQGARGWWLAKAKGKPVKASASASKVAALAGVSRSAVSRTFTDGASVSPKTRAKVLAAAEKLGYHVNALARGLIHHRSGIVCLVVAEMQTPFQAAFVEAATRHLQDSGKVVMVLNSAGRPEDVERALRLTLNYRAEATVVVSGAPPVALVERCLADGQRIVLLNRDDPLSGPHFVEVENAAAATEACFMLRRAGCRTLAVVSSTAGTPSLAAREAGFLAAAAEAGIAATVARAGPTGYAAGAEGARQLLAGSGRPDGVFCVTDLLALGFLDVARIEFRLQVPEEICVVGFDDIDAAGWLGYGLTTFRQPVEEIAACIASLLQEEPEAAPAPLRLPASVVWRRTVRP